jgi:hypothetical protein
MHNVMGKNENYVLFLRAFRDAKKICKLRYIFTPCYASADVLEETLNCSFLLTKDQARYVLRARFSFPLRPAKCSVATDTSILHLRINSIISNVSFVAVFEPNKTGNVRIT